MCNARMFATITGLGPRSCKTNSCFSPDEGTLESAWHLRVFAVLEGQSIYYGSFPNLGDLNLYPKISFIPIMGIPKTVPLLLGDHHMFHIVWSSAWVFFNDVEPQGKSYALSPLLEGS